MGKVRQPDIDYDGRALVDSHGSHTPQRIVIHDTEGHDEAGTTDLRHLGEFWHNQNQGYGAHIGVDREGLTGRYVNDSEVAWHVGGHNTGSLGIEQIGFASLGLSGWRARTKQMQKVARWIAWWSTKYGIPIEQSVKKGVCTHKMMSEAYPADTNHTDPGRYPLRGVLLLARAYKRLGW